MSAAWKVNAAVRAASDAQARELTLLGCHKAQSYHFARPLPPDGLEDWLPAPSLSRYEEEIWG